jgi:hypothetical protein
MRHPSDGTLRRLVDEPAGVADTDRSHVASCPKCEAGLATARDDAAAVALHFEISDISGREVDEGWQRLLANSAATGPAASAASAAAAAGADGSASPGSAGRPARWRALLRSPVIAGLAVAALLAGAGAAAAANWLPIFRAERVAPLVIVPSDLVQLPELSGYGNLEITSAPRVRPVADAAAAKEGAGLGVPHVAELPRGVTGEPSYRIGGKATATFTFSAAKAAQTAATEGRPLPPMPAGLDGSQFRLSAGPGVAATWAEARGVPALIVARAVAPTAFSGGVPFETARDYLLSLPGLPASVASQLRAFAGDGTLPLIVKAGQEESFTADVGGVQATVLATQDGAMAGVIWVDDGLVTVVGGSLSTDEVLTVARELTWQR